MYAAHAMRMRGDVFCVTGYEPAVKYFISASCSTCTALSSSTLKKQILSLCVILRERFIMQLLFFTATIVVIFGSVSVSAVVERTTFRPTSSGNALLKVTLETEVRNLSKCHHC